MSTTATKAPVKAVKNPTQSSSTPWFLIASVFAVAALIFGAVWYAKSTPMNTMLDGFEKESTNFSLAVSDEGVITLENDPKPEAITIDIYEDFTCIYCSKLAQASDADLKETVENGDIILNIHEMNFLDRGTIGKSTRTLAPAIAMAEAGDTEQYWNYRNLVYEEFETVSGNVGTDDELNTALIEKGFGKKYIATAKNDEALKRADETAAASINLLKEISGEVSSPRVFVGEIEIDPQDSDWVAQVIAADDVTLQEMQYVEEEEEEATAAKTDGESDN